LGASRHRHKDAELLQQSARWNGAIYLAGYAIECSLKSLICYSEHKDNLKETSFFMPGIPIAVVRHNDMKALDISEAIPIFR
jgi:hypothetical protein